ncbi:MAG TPA: acyltransferase [Terrimesophilobacter sp.]|nr:acyltransferase [Terrimesophilobacter sp.]
MTNHAGFVHETADVAADAVVGPGAKVWHYAQVREHATLGANCVVGRGAYVGTGVVVGENSKIQNYALVYEPARLERGVFIGPAVVLTNDHFPRAINADGSAKSADDWQPVGVTVLEGASIGASATCVAPVTIGRWALVGSGAVVIKDVPDFALVVGSPARRVGWAGRSGHPLSRRDDGVWVCPISGDLYREVAPDELVEVERA